MTSMFCSTRQHCDTARDHSFGVFFDLLKLLPRVVQHTEVNIGEIRHSEERSRSNIATAIDSFASVYQELFLN